MNIREQIGYPDYILEERNKHLDEEYSNVCPIPSQGPSKASPIPLPQPALPLSQPWEPSACNSGARGTVTDTATLQQRAVAPELPVTEGKLLLGGRELQKCPEPALTPPPPIFTQSPWPCARQPGQSQGPALPAPPAVTTPLS